MNLTTVMTQSEPRQRQMPRNPKKRPKKNQRHRLIKGRMAYDDRCFYCRIKMNYREGIAPRIHDDVTLEHRNPIIRGADGRHKRNIVLACYSCNQNKQEMTEQEWRACVRFKTRCEHVQSIERKQPNEYSDNKGAGK